MNWRNEGTWKPLPDTKVTLTCGCVIKVYDRPRPGTRLACQSNLRHGYNLPWVSLELPDGRTRTNESVIPRPRTGTDSSS